MSDKPGLPMSRAGHWMFGCLGLWAVLVIAWLLFMVVRGVTPTGKQTEIASEVLGKVALGATLVSWSVWQGVRHYLARKEAKK